jgi:hypothetical protein
MMQRQRRRAQGKRAPARKTTHGGGAGGGGRLVDFTAAAHEHREGAFFDVSQATGTSAVQLGPYDVPAFGFVRHVNVLVTVSAAGALGTGVLGEDFPFNIIDSVALRDTNGAAIAGPFSGYDLFLANLFGGYVFRTDPRTQPDYNASYTTVSFMLRIPVEIHHNDGTGSLANQNAAAAYKVELTLSPLATQLSSVGTATANTYRFRGFLEAWTQPAPVDLAGNPQMQKPPRHGTTQYWTFWSRDLASGDQTVQLPRVGNLIRTLIFVFRTPQGSPPASTRSTANFPDPVEIRWDARQLRKEARTFLRTEMAERYLIDATGGIPAGVFVYDFQHSVIGHGGDGTGELWLPTVQSTRLEIAGNFGASGTLRVLTNDVAPAEVDQSERYSEASETGGFRPDYVSVPVT